MSDVRESAGDDATREQLLDEAARKLPGRSDAERALIVDVTVLFLDCCTRGLAATRELIDVAVRAAEDVETEKLTFDEATARITAAKESILQRRERAIDDTIEGIRAAVGKSGRQTDFAPWIGWLALVLKRLAAALNEQEGRIVEEILTVELVQHEMHRREKRAELQCLVDVWSRQTKSVPELFGKWSHPAYQRIIGLGKGVLGALKELKTDPGPPELWAWAIDLIAGGFPEGQDRYEHYLQHWQTHVLNVPDAERVFREDFEKRELMSTLMDGEWQGLLALSHLRASPAGLALSELADQLETGHDDAAVVLSRLACFRAVEVDDRRFRCTDRGRGVLEALERRSGLTLSPSET